MRHRGRRVRGLGLQGADALVLRAAALGHRGRVRHGHDARSGQHRRRQPGRRPSPTARPPGSPRPSAITAPAWVWPPWAPSCSSASAPTSPRRSGSWACRTPAGEANHIAQFQQGGPRARWPPSRTTCRWTSPTPLRLCSMSCAGSWPSPAWWRSRADSAAVRRLCRATPGRCPPRPAGEHVHHPLRHRGSGDPPGRQGPDRHGRRADHGRLPRRGGAGPARRARCCVPGRGPSCRGAHRRAHQPPRAGVRGHRVSTRGTAPRSTRSIRRGSPVARRADPPSPWPSGEADVAYGTDTGGSVRIPAACCGIAGLKTTWGRVPLDGVRPLAPSLDTVGPMARDVAGPG